MGLNSYVDKLRYRSSEMLRKYDKEDDCESCRKEYYQGYLGIEKEIKKYLEVISYAKSNGIVTLQNTTSFFCNKLENLMRNINKAEMDLNELRTTLILGQAEWYRHEKDRFIKRQKDVERINNQRSRGENSQEARLSTQLLDKVLRESEKMNKDIPDGWMETCLDGSSEVGQLVNGEVPTRAFFRGHKIKELCKDAYANIFANLHRDSRNNFNLLLEEARIQAEFQYENARFRQIYDNPNAEMQHIIDMERWFTKLEYESECVGQMDKASPAYIKACRDLNPHLVALHNASKKARSEWENRCDDKWKLLEERFQGFHEGFSEEDQIRIMQEVSGPN